MGGSSDKRRSGGSSGTSGAPAAPAAPGNMTIQPFMTPDMQGLLASQLAMGFGGNPSQYQSPLFQPMQIPNYAGGAPLVPGAAAKTGNPGKKGWHDGTPVSSGGSDFTGLAARLEDFKARNQGSKY